ncbi:helix-turn-helix domain-containing protein [[Clostridium] dakarense]|uniref:helix-turn-helix domain-containing protein n=1 Tax=Faecalimicrobium dakarense TaxID=1301100 RepID=UPI0004B8D81D|nr:helix-turn-helix transcriptional regulator [[Clostridium] dakarense]
MNLGENLKKLRKEKNLSQEQLAKMLNVSRQAVSKWESGKTYPDIDNLILLRDIFNVTLDDLIINENKIKGEEIIEIKELPKSNYIELDEEEEDELSVNLMLGGLMIGTAIGFITDNFMWGTAGSFIGMGIGYILECIRKKDIRNEN